MKAQSGHQGQKRPFNLTLTETTVEQARHFTGNLSATVDGLLSDFVTREKAAQVDRQKLRNEVCDALNRFNAVHGSFADEHSTL